MNTPTQKTATRPKSTLSYHFGQIASIVTGRLTGNQLIQLNSQGKVSISPYRRYLPVAIGAIPVILLVIYLPQIFVGLGVVVIAGSIVARIIFSNQAKSCHPHLLASHVECSSDPTEYLDRLKWMRDQLEQASRSSGIIHLDFNGILRYCKAQINEAGQLVCKTGKAWPHLQKHEQAQEMEALRDRMRKIVAECERHAQTVSSSNDSGSRSWKEYPYMKIYGDRLWRLRGTAIKALYVGIGFVIFGMVTGAIFN